MTVMCCLITGMCFQSLLLNKSVFKRREQRHRLLIFLLRSCSMILLLSNPHAPWKFSCADSSSWLLKRNCLPWASCWAQCLISEMCAEQQEEVAHISGLPILEIKGWCSARQARPSGRSGVPLEQSGGGKGNHCRWLYMRSVIDWNITKGPILYSPVLAVRS